MTHFCDVSRDFPEILGDDRQITQGFFHFGEKLGAWSTSPFAMLSGWVSERHRVIPHEPTEVIETHDVYGRKDRLHTGGPPRVAVLLHLIPVVQRVAPKLARSAEVIRRNASH